MKELAIIPRRSIGPINLGASRREVKRILEEFGLPLKVSQATLDYYCNGSIQVEFEKDDTVRFIGISFNASYVCTYKGINVFDVSAEELFNFVAAGEKEPDKHVLDLYGYVFPDQILTLWDADFQYDYLGVEEFRTIYAQVGIGDDRYAAAIAKIKKMS
jgi:hypothetical protein